MEQLAKDFSDLYRLYANEITIAYREREAFGPPDRQGIKVPGDFLARSAQAVHRACHFLNTFCLLWRIEGASEIYGRTGMLYNYGHICAEAWDTDKLGERTMLELASHLSQLSTLRFDCSRVRPPIRRDEWMDTLEGEYAIKAMDVWNMKPFVAQNIISQAMYKDTGGIDNASIWRPIVCVLENLANDICTSEYVNKEQFQLAWWRNLTEERNAMEREGTRIMTLEDYCAAQA